MPYCLCCWSVFHSKTIKWDYMLFVAHTQTEADISCRLVWEYLWYYFTTVCHISRSIFRLQYHHSSHAAVFCSKMLTDFWHHHCRRTKEKKTYSPRVRLNYNNVVQKVKKKKILCSFRIQTTMSKWSQFTRNRENN